MDQMGKLTMKTFKQVERYTYADGQWLPKESELNLETIDILNELCHILAFFTHP